MCAGECSYLRNLRCLVPRVVSLLTWVLETQLRSSRRTASLYSSGTSLRLKYILKMELLHGSDNTPLKSHRLTKTAVPDMGNVPSDCQSQGSKRLPKNIACCCCPCLPPKTRRWDPLAEDTTYFRHRTWRNWTRTDLEVSFPRKFLKTMQTAEGKEESVILLSCNS